MACATMNGAHGKMIGRPRRRVEDAALLAGRACYSGDVALDEPLHVVFLRSPVARAADVRLGSEAAAAMPGVHAIHCAADLGATSSLSVNPILPLKRALPFPILAGDTLDCVGQPVAAVLADTSAHAQIAAEAIDLDFVFS